jgi:peptidoglycan/LPS O-acetylase OafA/YrhL
VFSLVDYRLYLAPAWVRLSLKVVITVALTTVCFRFIENPGRIYLNDPRRRRVASRSWPSRCWW